MADADIQIKYQQLEGAEGVPDADDTPAAEGKPTPGGKVKQINRDDTGGEVKPDGEIQLDLIADADLDPNILHALQEKQSIFLVNDMLAFARMIEFMRWHWVFIHLSFLTFFFFLLRYYSSIFDRHIAEGCETARNEKHNVDNAYIPVFILFGLTIVGYPIVWLILRERTKRIFARRTFYGVSGKLGQSDKQYISKKDSDTVVSYWKWSLAVYTFVEIAMIAVTVMVGIVSDEVDDLSYDCDCEGNESWYNPCINWDNNNTSQAFWWFTYAIWLIDLIICIRLLRKFTGPSKDAW
eukprot:CAMPEP_0202690754 /NCGR_PEP_ID=MMETSP1385-20130828/5650_1 /ASSEMBLY_ACC=CAM_ASM_000861 /TAXON_ID=933848 /ORGANISM="Elphidium margaritaceum" /LENGTH=294 /DNA_ID=CAMNT_0049346047 /DNA_START=48 /DNA_END=929 /DNA_ORIENTATION=-